MKFIRFLRKRSLTGIVVARGLVNNLNRSMARKAIQIASRNPRYVGGSLRRANRLTDFSETESVQKNNNSFFKNVSRADAEKILRRQGHDGAFLVRPSQSLPAGDLFILSVFCQEIVFHVQVKRISPTAYIVGRKKDNYKVFNSISSLISKYQREPLKLQTRRNKAPKSADSTVVTYYTRLKVDRED